MDELEALLSRVLTPIVEKAVKSALKDLPANKKQYPPCVGVKDAAEICGYSRNTLYQLHSRGLVPCAFKCGSKLMFRTKELIEWVENGGNSSRLY